MRSISSLSRFHLQNKVLVSLLHKYSIYVSLFVFSLMKVLDFDVNCHVCSHMLNIYSVYQLVVII